LRSQDIRFGERLHARNPDLCCRMRKVAPLNAALEGYAAWVTGVRRADAADAADAQLIEWDAKRSMLKINPIVGWSHDEVDRYAADNGVFLNPLRQLGFASIGCAPCTRLWVGEDPRAGRWAIPTRSNAGCTYDRAGLSHHPRRHWSTGARRRGRTGGRAPSPPAARGGRLGRCHRTARDGRLRELAAQRRNRLEATASSISQISDARRGPGSCTRPRAGRRG
jgi:hypothetical protein